MQNLFVFSIQPTSVVVGRNKKKHPLIKFQLGHLGGRVLWQVRPARLWWFLFGREAWVSMVSREYKCHLGYRTGCLLGIYLEDRAPRYRKVVRN